MDSTLTPKTSQQGDCIPLNTVTKPWGCERFQPVNKYAPGFHVPEKFRGFDANSAQIDLKWEGVQQPDKLAASASRWAGKTPPATVKPATACQQMQVTLNKINTLLNDISTRSKSLDNPSKKVQVNLSQKTTISDTLDSCLESLCKDVTSLSRQLETIDTTTATGPGKVRDVPSRDMMSDLDLSTTYFKTPVLLSDSDSGIGTDISADSPRSRVNTSSTLNASIPSLQTENSVEQDSTDTRSTRKRFHSTSSFYRGSEISQCVSQHKSTFSTIADLCGYGTGAQHPAPAVTSRVRRSSFCTSMTKAREAFVAAAAAPAPAPAKPPAAVPNKTSTHSDSSTSVWAGDNVYYTEYPPQKGGSTFRGIFQHDISGLHDEYSRGLVNF